MGFFLFFDFHAEGRWSRRGKAMRPGAYAAMARPITLGNRDHGKGYGVDQHPTDTDRAFAAVVVGVYSGVVVDAVWPVK